MGLFGDTTMQKSDIPLTGFVRLPQILSVIPVSRSTWWQWVKDGKAPAGTKLGPRITAWRVEEISALIASHGK
jgi:predicted DNA-binding transcriptional regulator AlpA